MEDITEQSTVKSQIIVGSRVKDYRLGFHLHRSPPIRFLITASLATLFVGKFVFSKLPSRHLIVVQIVELLEWRAFGFRDHKERPGGCDDGESPPDKSLRVW